MKTDAHTPTPWTWEVSPDGLPTIADLSSEAVATVETGSTADAAFIVRAVNTFEELVEALISAQEELRRCSIGNTIASSDVQMKVAAALDATLVDFWS